MDLSERPLSDLLSLDGRSAVVTGAGAGIGRAIALRLAELGAHLTIGDVDLAAAQETVGEIERRHGRSATAVEADVTRMEQVRGLADRAEHHAGPLRIWVNNAGIFPLLDPVEVTPEDVERVLRVNVLGTQLGLAESLRRMAPGGVVLNVISTAAFRGSGPYSASKWAVRGLTSGIAAEAGRRGVRVVGLAPTLTDTPGMRHMRSGSVSGDFLDDVVARIPLGRTGEPDDVARAAAFLASDAAGFVTGTTVVVDGGSLAAM